MDIEMLSELLFDSHDRLASNFSHVLAQMGPMGVLLAKPTADACSNHTRWLLERLARYFELDVDTLIDVTARKIRGKAAELADEIAKRDEEKADE